MNEMTYGPVSMSGVKVDDPPTATTFTLRHCDSTDAFISVPQMPKQPQRHPGPWLRKQGRCRNSWGRPR